MKSREIMEQFRKGNMNEKTMTHILVMLNERCDSNEKNLVEVARMMNKLSDLFNFQINAMKGMDSFVKHIQKKLGIEHVGVDSESVDERIHIPHGDLT